MHAKEHHVERFPLYIVCICCSIVTNKPIFASADYSGYVVFTKTIFHLSVGESGEFVLFSSRRGCSKTTIFTYVVSGSLSCKFTYLSFCPK